MNTRPINIVLLTDCFSTLQGGAERQIFELANRTDKTKYALRVVSLEADGACPREIKERLQCPYHAFPVKRIYGLSGITHGLKFRQFLINEKMDILLTYHFSSDIWGIFWGKFAGVKSIISNRRDMGFWRGKHHILAYRLINRWVKKFITVSTPVKEVLIKEEGITENKIQIIYNGIEPFIDPNRLRIHHLKEEYKITANDIIIVHVANLKPVKGHRFLLEALSQVVPQHPHVKLILIGEGKSKKELTTLCKKLNINQHVIFAGKAAHVREILDLADICVLPSLSEGMSNAMLEYMAAGKPTVTTNVGGNPELIRDGQEGFIVDKENADQLKTALIKLIENSSLRQTMGQAANKRVKEKFAIEEMIKTYETLFTSLACPRKKILHLISTSGFFGAEKVVLGLAEKQNQNGTISIVAAFKDPRLADNEIILRAQKAGLPTWELPVKEKIDFSAVNRLKKFLTSENIDLVHTHNYKSDLMGMLATKWTKKKIVSTVHGFTKNSNAVRLYEFLDKWILNCFMDRIITVNIPLAKLFFKKKVRIIPNGVSLKPTRDFLTLRESMRKKLAIDSSDCVLGTVGRFSTEKNQLLLLKGFKKLANHFPDTKLILIGDGPEKEKIVEFIKKENLSSKVILTGIVDNPEEYYPAMDIFTLTSDTEGLPMTLLEAMASGVAVVASDVGGIPEVIRNNETGLLFPKGNLKEFVTQCSSLIQNSCLRDKLKENAKHFILGNYTQEKTYAAYKKLYEEVLNT